MSTKKLLLCDCLGSQTIDRVNIESATGLSCSSVHRALCQAEAEVAARAMADGGAIIACRQEQAFFEELADSIDAEPPAFIDIRDRAGWTNDSRSTTPKMAALIADAMLATPPVKAVDVESAGQCLILGDTDTAVAAARQLADVLSVTVLLDPDAEVDMLVDRSFDVVRGRLVSATGAAGGFQIRIDALQERIPGGRGAPTFTPPRDGANTGCDIVLDLSGGTPLFPAPEKREGYLRADPKSPPARFEAIFQASQWVGTFEKPLYVRVEESLCAHSRASRTGCSRCLDNCPTGAITPAGDHVAVDPMVCAGCGTCAAICPSGAVSYDAPSAQTIFRRLDALASTWRKLSSDAPRLLVHDDDHGAEMVRLSARFGQGLPADVVPLETPALAAFGHAEALAALGVGFSQVSLLLAPRTEREGLEFQVGLANAIAGHDAVRLLDPADPDALDALLAEPADLPVLDKPILALGSRRQVTRLAAQALNRPGADGVAPILALPASAPYGTVQLDKEACTLCLSCVSLCPAGALVDNPDLPQLRFQEDACLQCGICVSACPENAITLEPRLNLGDDALSQKVINEEEPFACIECGVPFGVRSAIMKVTEKLAGKHSMFGEAPAIRMIQMCDNCRVNASFHSQNSPFAGAERPRVRTTEDYLAEEAKRRKH